MATIKLRRNTASEAASSNPVLAAGEPGWTTDTLVLKIGDGTTAWNDLAAVGGTGGDVTSDQVTVLDAPAGSPVGTLTEVFFDVAENAQVGKQWKLADTWLLPVDLVSTVHVPTTGPTTVDGVTLSVDDLVLLTNQSSGGENRIFKFDGADLVEASETHSNGQMVAGTRVVVTGGTHAGEIWGMLSGTIAVDAVWERVDVKAADVDAAIAAVTDPIEADVLLKAPLTAPVRTVSGTSDTPVVGDRAGVILFTSGSAISVSIPGSVFAAGDSFTLIPTGTGQITTAASGGATASTPYGAKSNGQNKPLVILFTSATTYIVLGDPTT